MGAANCGVPMKTVRQALSGRSDGERAAHDLAAQLRRQARALGLDDQAVLGPAPPPLERLRGRYRWQCLLRSADVRALRTLARVARAAGATARRTRLRLAIDVDPYAML